MTIAARRPTRSRTTPAVFFYVPENMPAPGCEVAARRTKKGYVVEAFVPFALLKLEGIRQGSDVNLEVKWMFAFMTGAEPVYEWTEGMFADFAKNKSATFVVQSIYGPGESRWKGRNAYCTAFLKVDHGYYREFRKRLRKLFPDGSVKHGIYYHCFIDNYDGNEVRFKDDRKLDAAGNHINYGGRYTYDRLYVPTLDNDFGKETAKVIDVILDDVGADGIFWDEFCTSRGEYTYNKWDGCSADIGKERILTNRSGYFGWGDASAFRAHVFDRDGKETDEIAVPRVVRDGKSYAEVRIPEGFSAALVRETKWQLRICRHSR